MKMPNVHGVPVQMGNPEEVGVMDVMKPDYGEAVDIYEGEIPYSGHAELHLRRHRKCKTSNRNHTCTGTYVYYRYPEF